MNRFPDEAGVRSGLPVSSSSAIEPNALRFDGVCAATPWNFAVLFADGVALLPPDSDSRSNSPSVFPSRCGVGPIAAFSGVWCALGLKSLRNADGESYWSSSAGWGFAVRFIDGVRKVFFAALRGVASSGCAGPVGDVCFRFFE